MKIVMLECRRIVNRVVFLGFLLAVIVISVYRVHTNLNNYILYDAQGISAGWKKNLSDTKAVSKGLYLDKACIESIRENEDVYGLLNYENIRMILFQNYEGKDLYDLTEDEMTAFFRTRVTRIYESLVQDVNAGYTDEELSKLLQKAGAVKELPLDYAEGWKVLLEDMSGYVSMLVPAIAVLLLALFGRDPQIKMEEMIRSTGFGKQKLDAARIVAAYAASSVLYGCGMLIYFMIMMLPFGFGGAGLPIQSNAVTFFSLYNITYLQQFAYNLLVGYTALIFMASFVLIITIIVKNILAAGSVTAIFWMMLLIFNRMARYPVNHWFANFLPVRMISFTHFYTGNELYHVFGKSISCFSFSVAVSLALSIFFLAAGMMLLSFNRRRVYCD